MKYSITSMNDIDSCINVNEGIRNFFVFVFGYEERSSYIIKKLIKKIRNGNIIPIPFFFADYNKSTSTKRLIGELTRLGFPPICIDYQDGDTVFKKVVNVLDDALVNNVFIDYSSMPRAWYCKFPELFAILDKQVQNMVFWYSKGDYKTKYDEFPNTGVQPEIEVFSGRATLRLSNERTHIFCLGYDNIRTTAIMSVIDPNQYAVVVASPTDDPKIRDNVISRNSKLINAASFQIEIAIEDFQFMVSKLSDISSQLLSKGDVILVPDGPKPLIMACSIVPHILEKHGVVCLHVKRHKKFYEPVNVTATGEVYGFVLSRY